MSKPKLRNCPFRFSTSELAFLPLCRWRVQTTSQIVLKYSVSLCNKLPQFVWWNSLELLELVAGENANGKFDHQDLMYLFPVIMFFGTRQLRATSIIRNYVNTRIHVFGWNNLLSCWLLFYGANGCIFLLKTKPKWWTFRCLCYFP